jgi:two-component system phosphate regulon response regulator PhoB
VLVVDGDPRIVALLKGLLTSKNYVVIKSYSGQEALKIVRAHHVDLIVCDVAMPSMSGYEFLTFLRKQPECAQIPVVFMTSAGAMDDRKPNFEDGIARCISKPFDAQTLLTTVQELIGRQALAGW